MNIVVLKAYIPATILVKFHGLTPVYFVAIFDTRVRKVLYMDMYVTSQLLTLF